tara:strand:+ start:27620 stop:28195 length:576 start_codon:yes stop_codon:yes gene_type:complete
MGDTYLTNPLIFLIQVIFGTYAFFVILRFLFQIVKADFYNPLSQFIIKITNPALIPLRKIIPSLGKLDSASFIFAWILLFTESALILFILNKEVHLPTIFLLSLPNIFDLIFNIFIYGIIFQAILSWINPGTYNPMLKILYELNEPILYPIRKFIPSFSGIDLSPVLALIGLYLLKMLTIPPLITILSAIF